MHILQPEPTEDDPMRAAAVLALAMACLGCAAEAIEEQPAVAAADSGRLTGTVLETLDVSSYSYVRLETAGGEVWAAVPQARLEIGATVVIENAQAMSNFESKVLKRQFDTIYFGTLPQQGSPSPMGGSNPHHALSGAAVSAEPIEVARAEGAEGRTVAELHAERAGLAGKTVTLRGKVVKYSPGIMGRNWIHLQDGTGDGPAGTHDITVTSTDSTAVGEIVLVQGTVAVDKDFGSGYRYDVIVEDASVK